MSIDNAQSVPQPGSVNALKRKRDDHRSPYKEVEAINLQSTSKSRAETFIPACLLPRGQLPLAWLDPVDGIQFFTGLVPMLERRDDEAALVLVAGDQSKRWFAIERAGTKKYALCQLSLAAERQVIERRAIIRYTTTKQHSKEGLSRKRQHIIAPPVETPMEEIVTRAVDSEHTEICPLPASGDDQAPAPTAIRAAGPEFTETCLLPVIIEGKAPSRTTARAVVPELTKNPSLPATGEDQAPTETTNLAEADLHEPTEQSANVDDVLAELSKQYLDSLYLSRASVAYFAKGPLARARATFSAEAGSVLHASALLGFLRELLLPVSTTDKRLKESIPEIIRELVEKRDDLEKVAPRKQKWKPKRDRQGFLTHEKLHVEQWWESQTVVDTTIEVQCSLQAQINTNIQALRSRETYLQIIIILEAMALGASGITTDASTEDTQASTTQEKKRTKKSIDLQNQLELLLDRLTIWHSIDFTSPAKKGDGNNGHHSTSDELRDFCTEVVIPFYKPRISKVAAFVNKKLGGPSAPTPAKHTLSRKPGEPADRRESRKPGETAERTSSRKTGDSADCRSSLKPGEPADRRSSRKPGEPVERSPLGKRPCKFHRIATDSQLQGRAPPTLSRSVTDSMLQERIRVKRESPARSLHSIPPARQRSDTLASLTRRQIDLAAVSAATESRLRKKAEQEARVKEAVAAIRRPDRSLALKETAARVDSSFSKHLPPSRKAVSTEQVPHVVAATPNVSRYIAVTPSKDRIQPVVGVSSAMLAVPQTGHRQRIASPPGDARLSATLVESPILQRSNRADCTPSRPRTLLSLDETPVVKHPMQMSLTETPLMERRATMGVAEKSLAKQHGQMSLAETPLRKHHAQMGMAETPLPKQHVRIAFAETPLTKSHVHAGSLFATKQALDETSCNVRAPTASRSVYDQLGWNNDDYEELA